MEVAGWGFSYGKRGWIAKFWTVLLISLALLTLALASEQLCSRSRWDHPIVRTETGFTRTLEWGCS